MKTIIIIIFLFFFTSCSQRYEIGNGYYLTESHWGKRGTCVVTQYGKIVIPPSISTFWGKYPYLYGQAYDYNKKDYYFFLFDVTNGNIFIEDEIMKELQKSNISFSFGYEQINFFELMGHDSIIDKERVNIFKKSMSSP